MQYTSILLSALAAVSTLAAPTRRTTDDSIKVLLSGSSGHLWAHTSESQLPATKHLEGSSFEKVELQLGSGVKNTALRCQILDDTRNAIVIKRGENIDTTFADGDKGEWTFQNGPAIVTSIICDAKFVAEPFQDAQVGICVVGADSACNGNDADKDTSIRATLLGPSELAIQIPFEEAGLVREERPRQPGTLFNAFNLDLGADVQNQALRCKVLDERSRPITAKRGENVDTTFADGGNGPWSFIDARTEQPITAQVSSVICDPVFVKAA